MTTFGLLAVRPPHEAKTRLAAALSPVQRETLAWHMARHVLNCMTKVLTPGRCIVISRADDVLDHARAVSAIALKERGFEYNAALTQGAHHAIACGAERVLSFSSDLPMLQTEDVQAMLAQDGTTPVTFAPDRHGLGTNAICMHPPLVLPYIHGRNSLARHYAAAADLGLKTRRVDRIGLAHDVDDATDLYPDLSSLL